jgi:hypothetical protein
MHALRVHPAHHVPDRAVFAAGIQRLQADQHPVGVLRGRPPPVVSQQLDTCPQQLPALAT